MKWLFCLILVFDWPLIHLPIQSLVQIQKLIRTGEEDGVGEVGEVDGEEKAGGWRLG